MSSILPFSLPSHPLRTKNLNAKSYKFLPLRAWVGATLVFAIIVSEISLKSDQPMKTDLAITAFKRYSFNCCRITRDAYAESLLSYYSGVDRNKPVH